MSPYDRIELVVAGTQTLSARPIDFEFDEDNEPISVTRYETTCPECGQMIVFESVDVVVRDGVSYIGCNSCGKGHIPQDQPAPVPVKQPEVVIAPSGQRLELERPPVIIDRGCPFIDPVEAGIFELTQV